MSAASRAVFPGFGPSSPALPAWSRSRATRNGPAATRPGPCGTSSGAGRCPGHGSARGICGSRRDTDPSWVERRSGGSSRRDPTVAFASCTGASIRSAGGAEWNVACSSACVAPTPLRCSSSRRRRASPRVAPRVLVAERPCPGGSSDRPPCERDDGARGGASPPPEEGRGYAALGESDRARIHHGWLATPDPGRDRESRGADDPRRSSSRGRESNPQETDLQSVALTILPPRRGEGQEGPP